VDDDRWDRFCARKARFESNGRMMDETLIRSASGDRVPASQLLRQPETRLSDLLAAQRLPDFQTDSDSAEVDIASIETTIKYAGYLRPCQFHNDRRLGEGQRAISR
jgi:hypothetical protein